VSVEVIAAVLQHSPTKGNAKIILLGLANHAHPDGSHAFPSVPTLARYARVDDRTVQRQLRELVAGGHIEATGLGPQGQTAYRVCLERLNQLELAPEAGGGKLSPPADCRGATPVPPEGGDSPAAPGTSPGGDTAAAPGVTAVSPEPSFEPSSHTPPAPRKRGEPGIASSSPPVRPTSKRDRDHVRYRGEMRSWLAANLQPSLEGDAELWASAREQLRTSVREDLFEIWLEPLALAGRLRGDLTVVAPTDIAEWVRERFADALRAAAGDQTVRIVPALDEPASAATTRDQLAGQRRAA
jgi:hypothetical protein